MLIWQLHEHFNLSNSVALERDIFGDLGATGRSMSQSKKQWTAACSVMSEQPLVATSEFRQRLNCIADEIRVSTRC